MQGIAPRASEPALFFFDPAGLNFAISSITNYRRATRPNANVSRLNPGCSEGARRPAEELLQ
jgi:hypothetical protein